MGSWGGRILESGQIGILGVNKETGDLFGVGLRLLLSCGARRTNRFERILKRIINLRWRNL